jgi:hypothetical protein
MATATKTPRSIHDATEQAVALNERFVEAGKGVTSFQQKLAGQSDNDTVKSVLATQADVARLLTSAYTSAARELIS